jgi:uncharacterized membrane protein
MNVDTFLTIWLFSMPIVAIGFVVYFKLNEEKLKGKYEDFIILAFLTSLLPWVVLFAIIVAVIIMIISNLIFKLIKLLTPKTEK